MYAIIKELLDKNSFNVDNRRFKLLLNSHPDYPSFLSIKNTLDHFNIKNVAVNLSVDNLTELPESFIAIIKDVHNTEKIVLVLKKSKSIIIKFIDYTKEILTYTEFKKKWTGTILAVENSQQENKKLKLNSNIIIPTLFIISLLTGLFINFNFILFSLTILSLLGIYISYLIVKEEFGIKNRTISKVCNKVNKSGSCSDIINSKKGILYTKISLSDISIVFFSYSFFIYLIIGYDSYLSTTTAILTILVIIYSLFQQAFVLKQWCILCIAIIAILTLQNIIILGIILPHTSLFSLEYLLKSTMILLSFYMIWKHVKPFLIEYFKLKETEEDYYRFKRKKGVFNTLLKKEKSITNEIPTNSLSFGSKNPVITINAITNPMCIFCKDSFETYVELLEKYKSIRLNLIFNTPYETLEDTSTQIASKILDLYYNNERKKAFEALKEWYSNTNIKSWSHKYNIEKRNSKYLKTLKKNSIWCIENDVNYTPATIINGKLFPKEFQISDISLFINQILLEKEKNMAHAII